MSDRHMERSTPVEPLPAWDALWADIRRTWRVVVASETGGIAGRWRLGQIILGWQAQHDETGTYGEAVIARIAAGLKLAPSTVYQYRAFALACPTHDALEAILGRLQEAGQPLEWTTARRAILGPVGANPRQVGPPPNRVEKIGGVLEAAIGDAERIVQNGGIQDADGRAEFAGVLVQTAQTALALARHLTTEEIVLVPEVVTARLTPDTWPPSWSEAFQAWVRAQPCACCGRTDGVQFAHFLHSAGAGGQDWAGIPLCLVHHTQYHMEGTKTWWDGWKYQVLAWYGRTLAALWMREEEGTR